MHPTIQLLINHLQTYGDYSSLELAACEVTPHTNYYRTMYSDESQEQLNWYRLLPDSNQLEPLNTLHDGSFSIEASNERWQAWPDALDVSLPFLLNEAAHRGGKPYIRCSFCAGVAYDFCDECSRRVCVMHLRQYDGNDKPLCPEHFDASLNDRKKRQRLAQVRSLFPESS
jgi:hypothetical protein